jgi:hypothetical protein
MRANDSLPNWQNEFVAAGLPDCRYDRKAWCPILGPSVHSRLIGHRQPACAAEYQPNWLRNRSGITSQVEGLTTRGP